MLLYTAVRCPDEGTRQMLTYARLVLHLAQKHGGAGWLEYDHTFRAQAAANPSLAWNDFNPSLMASAVLSSASIGVFCHHCQEVDHGPSDCALLALDPSIGSSTPLPQRRTVPSAIKPTRGNRPSPYDLSVEVCRWFNRGQCPDAALCRYRHICSTPECKRTSHGAVVCPLRSVNNFQCLTKTIFLKHN